MSKAQDLLEDLADATDSQVSIAKTLSCLMEEFGGPAGFAHEVKLVYDDPETGSASRVRILSDTMRAMQAHGEPDDPDEDIEDMERTAASLMQSNGQ